jgi:hypothetical protein
MTRNKHVTLVLGMHRSGTSAVTRALIALGAHVGSNLVPPAIDNPRGFFECLDVVNLNNKLLSLIGLSFLSLGDINPKSIAQEDLAILRDEANTLISRLLSVHDFIVVKDPRICRLLWFWIPLLEQSGVHLSCVVVVRNPLSVASSLAKRNNLTQEHVFLLWLQHLLLVVIGTAKIDRFFIKYDSLISEPQLQIARMKTWLIKGGIEIKYTSQEMNEYINDFLSPELSHSVYEDDEPKFLTECPDIVIHLYQLLSQASNNEWVGENSLNTSIQECEKYLEAIDLSFSIIKQKDLVIQRKNEELQHITQLVALNVPGANSLSTNKWAPPKLVESLEAVSELLQVTLIERDEMIAQQNKQLSNLRSEIIRAEAQLDLLKDVMLDNRDEDRL